MDAVTLSWSTGRAHCILSSFKNVMGGCDAKLNNRDVLQVYSNDSRRQAICHPTNMTEYKDGYKSFPSGHVSCKAPVPCFLVALRIAKWMTVVLSCNRRVFTAGCIAQNFLASDNNYCMWKCGSVCIHCFIWSVAPSNTLRCRLSFRVLCWPGLPVFILSRQTKPLWQERLFFQSVFRLGSSSGFSTDCHFSS